MTQINAFEACCLFTALKLHFTSNSYDFHKYDGKVSMSVQAFEQKKDKYFWHKIVKRYNREVFMDLAIANLLKNPKAFSMTLLSEDAEYNLKTFQKKVQSLEYTFSEDVGKLVNKFEQDLAAMDKMLVVTDKNEYPLLLQYYFNEEISFETLIIINRIWDGKIFKVWSKKIEDSLVWPKTRSLAEKYEPFLRLDIPKFKALLKKKL